MFRLTDSIFRLSKKHQNALIEDDETVNETIAVNEAFLAQGAQLRDPIWKLVVSRKDRQRPSRVYRARTGSHKRLASTKEESTLFPSSVVVEGSIQEKMKRSNFSFIVFHGTVDGTLDDSMFRAYAASDRAWKLRSSHVKDRLDDARILTTRSYEDRPLQDFWYQMVCEGVHLAASRLSRNGLPPIREEKSNATEFSWHYVPSPICLKWGILRGELSFCFILRQSGPGKAELYCCGFSDPHGQMMERMSVATAAEALICSATTRTHTALAITSLQIVQHNLTKFALLAVVPDVSVAGKGSACQICRREVRSKCSVVKMTVDVSDTGTVKQWADSIVTGACFPDQKSCTKAMHQYAVSHNMVVKLAAENREGGAMLRYHCAGEGNWRFEVTMLRSQGKARSGYFISHCNLVLNRSIKIDSFSSSGEDEFIRSLVANDPRINVRPVHKQAVNIEVRTCICTIFDQDGIPCKHFIVALGFLDRPTE
ncbi:LOW QUALITY PROTEIN: Hypothetical protein PHPALM_17682 [Phytophthora palmivora]|uniref:SWIM-type domain-containing protein n=1 Tax=Phytophthora palmivora TaxID=4796 RepID=A0A2P4XLL5_9STRA|nr:LOW QUALITY PROTEIN: Hypothetical protein PHPALM_17682 [Phytophthora palmivora]